MARVSVIVPTFNGAQFIGETIDSVLAQSFPEIELIVVNDGSTDGTEEVLRHYGDRLKSISAARGGIPSARNLGVKASTGDLLCFLDHDDLWFSDKIAKQVEVFEKHPEIGFCFSDYETFGDPAPYRLGFEESGGKVRALPRQQLEGQAFMITTDSLFIEMVNGALPCWTSTIMLRRSTLDQVGPFDEALRINDDSQMWLRFAKKARFAYLDEVLVRQRVRSAGTSLSMSQEQKQADSISMFERLVQWVVLSEGEQDAVTKRTAGLCVSLGYLDFINGRLKSAGGHFRKSLRLKYSTWVLGFYFLTFLPESSVRHLRALKHRVSG